MLKPEVKDLYTTTVGIECHVQLKTNTKLFSAVNNDAREAEPNTLVSHIDFGLPGALPVLNEAAYALASKAAFALNSVPQPFSKFDRKHYFYPDLPMGYQITQFDEPIILGGKVTYKLDGEVKAVNITRAHLEADAGKSVHPAGQDYSLVDLNRAGTPLLEIVSEPEMHTAAEAKAYVRELWLLMRYAEVSEANLYYGNMRFDVNVSVSKTNEMGTRTETKNLNSFRSVEKTVEYEVERQIEVLEKGGTIVQETRGWDDAKQKTISQRTKETADDYRYMPDPDIPPVLLSEEYIERVKQSMSVMPNEWRAKLTSLGIDEAHIETLLEAEVEHPNANFLELIEANLDDDKYAKFLANWVVNLEVPLRNEDDKQISLDYEERSKLYNSVYKLSEEGLLSSTNVKAILTKVLGEQLPSDLKSYAEQNGYIQNSNEDEIAAVVAEVLKDNPKAVEDIKNGETKAIGYLVGQVMKLSKGKANPSLAQQLIRKLVEE
jgi:aspartyl-tRNA(Asn)/glutamyl-tRNA(Gln) amidotransferase subunit B